MAMRKLVLAVVVVVGLSCEGGSDVVKTNITLLVTNTTCTPGPCSPIRVVGFPAALPATPFELVVVSGATACITFPVSRGSWDLSKPLALGAQLASAPVSAAVATSNTFVAGTQYGWNVSVPGATSVTPGTACTS